MTGRFLVVFLLLAGTGFSQTFVGTVDGYFGYNLNKPQSHRNLYRNFDFKHNQFSLNYAEIAIEQKPGDTMPVGFRADVGFGDAATWVHAAEPAGADVFPSRRRRTSKSHLWERERVIFAAQTGRWFLKILRVSAFFTIRDAP